MLVHCCCCENFAIAVINSNAIFDDSFKVILNGTEIGVITNGGPNGFCTGRIWAQDTSVTTYTGLPCAGTLNLDPTLLMNMDWLVTGSNTLSLESISDNNNGNAGTVQVLCLQSNGSGGWTIGSTFLSAGYSFFDGIGNGQNFTFNYP